MVRITVPGSEVDRDHAMLVHCLRGSLSVQSRFQLLLWLQSDIQELLPHDALIVVRGNFEQHRLQHTIISSLPGLRADALAGNSIHNLRQGIYKRWLSNGKRVTSAEFTAGCFADSRSGELNEALGTMRHALFHALIDGETEVHHLYLMLRSANEFSEVERQRFALLLPHIDVAIRRTKELPNQGGPQRFLPHKLLTSLSRAGLSTREMEILEWVRNGKTNIEIGMILDISAYTVKNHLQRIFRKLDVSNRAQAVGMLEKIGATAGQ